MIIQEPYVIKGGVFSDHRGKISFVNDFHFDNIKRFYVFTQSPDNGSRAWQGHQIESKHFYCTKGSYLIKTVQIDDWEKPSKNLRPLSFRLTAENSKILIVPPGYANAIVALQPNSQLLVFSDKTMDKTKSDMYRFDKELWINQ